MNFKQQLSILLPQCASSINESQSYKWLGPSRLLSACHRMLKGDKWFVIRRRRLHNLRQRDVLMSLIKLLSLLTIWFVMPSFNTLIIVDVSDTERAEGRDPRHTSDLLIRKFLLSAGGWEVGTGAQENPSPHLSDQIPHQRSDPCQPVRPSPCFMVGLGPFKIKTYLQQVGSMWPWKPACRRPAEWGRVCVCMSMFWAPFGFWFWGPSGLWSRSPAGYQGPSEVPWSDAGTAVRMAIRWTWTTG